MRAREFQFNCDDDYDDDDVLSKKFYRVHFIDFTYTHTHKTENNSTKKIEYSWALGKMQISEWKNWKKKYFNN